MIDELVKSLNFEPLAEVLGIGVEKGKITIPFLPDFCACPVAPEDDTGVRHEF